jgi:hypothetical protein
MSDRGQGGGVGLRFTIKIRIGEELRVWRLEGEQAL